MTQEEIYKTIRNEITKSIYNYEDQMMAISAWIESEFEKKGKEDVCPKCGDYGVIQDNQGVTGVCPCHL